MTITHKFPSLVLGDGALALLQPAVVRVQLRQLRAVRPRLGLKNMSKNYMHIDDLIQKNLIYVQSGIQCKIITYREKYCIG